MYSFLLQDWTSPKINLNQVGVTQSECDWLSLEAYQDIIFHTEVKSADPGGTFEVRLAFQTGPSKDESMFKDMDFVSLVPGTTSLTRVILASNPYVPLSRWVRWDLRIFGTPVTDYSATFRVLCSANAVGSL